MHAFGTCTPGNFDFPDHIENKVQCFLAGIVKISKLITRFSYLLLLSQNHQNCVVTLKCLRVLLIEHLHSVQSCMVEKLHAQVKYACTGASVNQTLDEIIKLNFKVINPTLRLYLMSLHSRPRVGKKMFNFPGSWSIFIQFVMCFHVQKEKKFPSNSSAKHQYFLGRSFLNSSFFPL